METRYDNGDKYLQQTMTIALIFNIIHISLFSHICMLL